MKANTKRVKGTSMAAVRRAARLQVQKINAFAQSRTGKLAITQAVQRAAVTADQLRLQGQIDPKKLDLPITL